MTEMDPPRVNAMPERDVEEIDVPEVPEPDEPDPGVLDPSDSYAEGDG